MYNKTSSQGCGMVRNGSAIDTAAEIKKEESKLVKQHSGHTVVCAKLTAGKGTCGETFLLNSSDYSAEECMVLARSLKDNGCPYCKGERDNYASDSVELERLSVGTKIFVTIRKPQGWRPARKLPLMSEIERRHNRAMKNYVK